MAGQTGKDHTLGIFYGIVQDNYDETGQGRILVSVGKGGASQHHHFIAYPLGLRLGNRRVHKYNGKQHYGSVMIPEIGEKVLLLGSNTDAYKSTLYYLDSFNLFDDEVPVLPEIGLDTDGKKGKRRVLFRNINGQSIYFSVASADPGVRITGKKYQYNPKIKDPQYKTILKLDDNQSAFIIHDEKDLSRIEIIGLKSVTIRDNHSQAIITLENGVIKINANSVVEINTPTVNINANSSVNIDTPQLNISNNVNIGGNVSVGGNLGVSGNLSLGGSGGNATISGNATVEGNVQVNGNLSVDGSYPCC